MPSVAGQLRIDLLANAAGFKAGLREGRQELGSFEESAKRFKRVFDSQKESAARAEQALKSWKSALSDIRQQTFAANKTDPGVMGRDFDLSRLGNSISGDKTTQLRLRRSRMLPFGESLRTEMSREAAETAAALGKEKNGLLKKLGEASNELGGGGGSLMGGLMSKAGRIATNPITAVAAAVVGTVYGAIAQSASERKRDRAASESALVLGQSYEDASRLNAIGFDTTAGARLSRSISERSGALSELKLDANKLGTQPFTESLTQVAEALQRVGNYADRDRLSMELFGRSGAELIPTLTNLREKLSDVADAETTDARSIQKTRRFDHAAKATGRMFDQAGDDLAKSFGIDSGFGTSLTRFAAYTGALFTRDWEGNIGKLQQQFDREDFKVQNAAATEQMRIATAKMAEDQKKAAESAKKQAEELERARKAATDIVAGVGGSFQAARYAGGSAEADWREKAAAAGFAPGEIELNAEFIRKRQQMTEGMGRANAVAKDAAWNPFGSAGTDSERRLDDSLLTARHNRDQANADADLWRKYAVGRDDAETTYQRMRAKAARDYHDAEKQALRSYYQEAMGLDSESIRRKHQDAGDAYHDRLGALDQMQGKLLTPEEVAAEKRDQRKSYREGLGVKDPEADFAKRYRDLKVALANKDISPEEFARETRKARRAAVEGFVAENGEGGSASPMAALQRGSREAYALLAQTQMNDPKVALAAAANQKLDKIIANTDVRSRASTDASNAAADWDG